MIGVSASPGKSRRLARAALAVAIVLGALTIRSPIAFAIAIADPPWFKIAGKEESRWRVETIDPSGSKLRLTRFGASESPASKHLLVIYGRASSAYDIAIDAMLTEFADSGQSTIVDVVNYNGDATLGERFLGEAAADNMALIFTMGSEATALAVSAYAKGAVPVVSVCAKDPVLLGQTMDYTHGSGTNFAFTSLNLPMDQLLFYLTKLRPGLKAIGVLVDGNNLSAVQTQAEPLAAIARQGGIVTVPIEIRDPKAITKDLATLMPLALDRMRQADPDLSHSLLWLTGSTALFKEIATINELAQNVPLVSAAPELVRSGAASAVVSIGITFESNGQLAARYGLDILSGRGQPSTMAVGLVSPPEIAVNVQQARRIHFRLPFEFVETATFLFDSAGRLRRRKGQEIELPTTGGS